MSKVRYFSFSLIHNFVDKTFLSSAYGVSPGPTSRNSFILFFILSFRIQLSRRRRQASYDVARLLLMAPIDPWRNSAPDFGAVAFCTTNIEDFRTPLTSTSSTISSTYSSQKRSLRWTSSKRKIMEVIEVDQLEDTNNKRLSWALPHSGPKPKRKMTQKRKTTFVGRQS